MPFRDFIFGVLFLLEKNMKVQIRKAVSLKDKVAVAALLAIASAASMAQTGDTDQGVQAITDLGTKATSYIAAAFTVAVLVAGGFWGIRMMKKAFGAAK